MMKKLFLVLIMCATTLGVRATDWETFILGDTPIFSQLDVYRSAEVITYRYLYDYRDSTFHIQVFPDARVLAAVKNAMDRTPVRPAFVEVKIRFKGCPDGKKTFTYRLTNPNPDAAQIVSQGFFDNTIKDDGNILAHMRSCSKMEIQYWDFRYWRHRTIELKLKGFESTEAPQTQITDTQ